jgi:hypothetical protein
MPVNIPEIGQAFFHRIGFISRLSRRG